MAFCTRCGQQTDGAHPAAGGAELCLFCGAGPEVHHGYPGRRVSRHASPADVYAHQNGAGTGTSACRVPLSDYPSLTDLPAIADTWPSASYSSRSRAGRHALPPEAALLRPRVTARLALRPGPPEFQDEQFAAGPFSLPDGLHEPRSPQLPEPELQQGQESHLTPDDEGEAQDARGSETEFSTVGRPVRPVRATASRALLAARESRRVSAAAAGLVVLVGAATAAIAMAHHNPQASGQDAGDVRLGMATPGTGDGTGSGGLVRPASAAAAAPQERPALSLLDRYFAAINAHDFAAYQKLFRPAVRSGLSETDFIARYGTATDSAAILHSITPVGRRELALMVTFTSHQRPSSSRIHSSCTNWSVRLNVVRDGSRYLMDNPPAADRPSGYACL